jgi:hypothetical protein
MADLTNAIVVGDAADVAEALPLVVDRIGR